jgi:hypothetical protein
MFGIPSRDYIRIMVSKYLHACVCIGESQINQKMCQREGEGDQKLEPTRTNAFWMETSAGISHPAKTTDL